MTLRSSVLLAKQVPQGRHREGRSQFKVLGLAGNLSVECIHGDLLCLVTDF